MYLPQLSKRQFGYGYGDGDYDQGGGWENWGRWVVLGVVIFVALALFLGFACITARRRRRHGNLPYRGTGWLVPQHGAVQYYGPNGGNNQHPLTTTNQWNRPAPPYTGPAGSNSGYYGQENGIQQPHSTYQPQRESDTVYSPPAGPPPEKKNNFFR